MPSLPSPTSPRSAPVRFLERASYFDGASDQPTAPIAAAQNNAGPRVGFTAGDPPTPDPEGRRTSVQFTQEALRRGSSAKTVPQLNRRMSSPPPPRTYTRGVSFDTFVNRDATDFSLTLNYKHKDYQHTRRSRTFLCGTDQKDYSEFALQYLLDELVDDGDEIICLRVVEKDSKVATDGVEEGKYRTEAQNLLDHVISKNQEEESAISLIIELAVGKVQEIIQRMIQIYEPIVLVVGTRGRNLGGMQGLLPGSVSKYCLQESPIPVIVVRPEYQREKKKHKRLNDPNRRDYSKILELSTTLGSQHLLDKANRRSKVGDVPSVTDQEAVAVARAIGLPKSMETVDEGAPLTRVYSAKSDGTSGPESPSPTDPLSPDPHMVVMKSPVLGPLDSPVGSEEEDEYADERRDRFESQPGRSVGAVVDDDLTKISVHSPSRDGGAIRNGGKS